MPRMLIVEDSLVNQEFLRLSLRGCGECDIADRGEDALRLVEKALDRAEPYAVIFMDIMLPGMDGLQTLERIRAMENQWKGLGPVRMPVIITTSLDDNSQASRAFIHGQAVSYMTKPFRARDVIEELRKLGLIENAQADTSASDMPSTVTAST
jgi:Response regulators consisting of a CheY-like receiver domain and a winged-helix DNA-binding domain